MQNKNLFQKYLDSVDAISSQNIQNNQNLILQIQSLDESTVPVSRLLISAMGLSGEAGEFTDLVKKILFQGTPFSQNVKEKLILELGDVMWYVAQACIALDVEIEEVLARNTEKLSARYPEGHFSIHRSQNRSNTDL